jgi:hypothetical protein
MRVSFQGQTALARLSRKPGQRRTVSTSVRDYGPASEASLRGFSKIWRLWQEGEYRRVRPPIVSFRAELTIIVGAGAWV